MNRILKYIFYGLIAFTFIFCFIPLFRIDVRPTPNSDPIYIYQSLFIQGFHGKSINYYSLPFHYFPIVVIILIAIPYINRIIVLTDILLGLSMICCFLEMFLFNNDLMFGLLLIIVVIITVIYNISYFLEKEIREREKYNC